MTVQTLCLIVAIVTGSLAHAAAATRDVPPAEAVAFPPRVALVGPHAFQRLLVEARRESDWTGDLTARARFSSSNAGVATVDAEGVVRPVADGRAEVAAKVGGRRVAIPVTVSGMARRDVRSFRNQVEPILTKAGCNSGACHGASAGKGGLKLTLRGYDPEADHAVLTRQALGRRVAQGDPQRSLMLRKPTLRVPHGGGQRFRSDTLEYRVLAEWIRAGAPPPAASEARLERLEVFPPAARLRPGEKQQILVRAHFSDGRVEDVTRWVKFGSSDDTVASVGDDGRVTVQGRGEAAITVWYLSRVAFARIAAPFPVSVARDVFRRSPRQGFIDAHVLTKLEMLGIPPSAACTDAEFLRRAYLDAAGILPAAAEAERFLADPDPRKREKLIEALLERPEFVDYWAYKWSDLFLVSSRKLASPAMWAFYNWLRASVAANKPWDQLAGEILTATGSTLENGAANYFVLHRDAIDLTETTSQAFLGMSLTCARCHNHPLEKWTQNDYYQMANLFARVKLKNGEQRGEVLVFPDDSGDLPHPRTGKALPPRPLEGRAMALAAPGDRRAALAAWLTASENPYFARALVNRVWRNFMGRGLVEAEDDLRLTNPPSNEALLAALSRDFMAHRYDVKHLIRTIMRSAAYQRSSAPNRDNARDEKYYSHAIVRRLPAEVILDAVSQVTGIPQEFTGYPKGYRALQLPDSQVASYFLGVFGRPERVATCSCERQQETTVAQALHMTNGGTINDKLRAPGGIIDALVEQKVSDEDVLRRLFLTALSRLPTDADRQRILPILAESPARGDPAARRAAIEDLFWATLTGREFLFNH